MSECFRADLHVHSRYSDASGNAGIRALRSTESFTDPLDLYRAERARGMDFVTITDHNSLAGSLAIAHLPGTFLSVEFDTWFPEDGVRVHVVALDIDEATFAAANALRENVHDLVACLRAAGVTHYLAHPLFDMSGKLTPESVERMLLLFNVLEGRNGSRTSRCNGLLRAIVAALSPEQLEAMAERHRIEPFGETPWRKALTGGSDDHSGLFSASAYTIAGGDGTAAGFVRAVAAGDCDHQGADGDSRLLAHSIYAASFWKIRELLRLDEQNGRQRALSLLRQGFGRIGRDVPVLEKTLRGVRKMAPGLYRQGDPRGPSWEALLDREIGQLLAHPDGTNAVDAKELNRRIFVVAQRLADDVMSMHLRALLDGDTGRSLKRSLQSLSAVGMVAFLEIPYYFAWSFQSRDRELQEQLRAYFLGERRRTWREKVAVLCAAPPASLHVGGDGRDGDGHHDGRDGDGRLDGAHSGDSRDGDSRAALAPAFLDVDVTLLACTVDGEMPRAGVVSFDALAWHAPANGESPSWVIPPLVEIVDYIEEERFTAIHTDSAAGQGLVALAAARLLHLPVTGAVDPAIVNAPQAPGDFAGRLRRLYLRWFCRKLDEAYVPTREAAQALVTWGVDPSRVTVLPADHSASANKP